VRIAISHQSEYTYDRDGGTTVQALRLSPPRNAGQSIETWRISAPGIETAACYTDAFGNVVYLIASNGEAGPLVISAEGVVHTSDTAGIVGFTDEAASPAVYLRETRLTKPNAAIAAMAQSVLVHIDGVTDEMNTLHALMAAIHAQVAYEISTTHSATSAAEAFAGKRGVCQDHAHIFISAARLLGIPSRYVTGYLLTDGTDAEAAHHAWAEALVPLLGWVGFDPANKTCPTERYIRLAVGLDAAIAAPIRGVRRGPGAETLVVTVAVRQAIEQAPQQ